jgi:transposase-like protein
MGKIICKNCNSKNFVKNGKVRKQQRFVCKDCGYNFIDGDKRNTNNASAKALSVLMYASGAVNYEDISNIFQVSKPAVFYWIKSLEKNISKSDINSKFNKLEHKQLLEFIEQKGNEFNSSNNWITLETEISDKVFCMVLIKPIL